MEQIINIKDNIVMKDKINNADASIVQVGAVSPAGLCVPSVNFISSDIKILFEDDLEFKPKC